MIYPGGSSQKNYEARLFPDTGVLTYQAPDKIYETRKLDTVFIKFQ